MESPADEIQNMEDALAASHDAARGPDMLAMYQLAPQRRATARLADPPEVIRRRRPERVGDVELQGQ